MKNKVTPDCYHASPNAGHPVLTITDARANFLKSGFQVFSGEAGLDQMMEGTFSSHLMNYAKGLSDGGNIIVFLSTQGQDAIEWGTGMVAGGAVTVRIGSVIQKVPGVATLTGGAFKSLGSPLVMVGSQLVVEGAILSYDLPFIPTVIMAVAIVGWLLLVVELMVAAPNFAAALAFADGEGT